MNIGFGVRKWDTVKLISLIDYVWFLEIITQFRVRRILLGNFLGFSYCPRTLCWIIFWQFHGFECIVKSEKCWSIVIIRTWGDELTSWVSSFHRIKDSKCCITLLLCDVYSQRIRTSALKCTYCCIGQNSNKSETVQNVTTLNIKWRLFYKHTFSENLQQIVRSPFLREF